MAMGSSSSGKAYHSSGGKAQPYSSSTTNKSSSNNKLRYKGLFTPNVAPVRRAYCILFSFFCGVLMITAGSVFTRVILIHPMSGSHPMHTPSWPLAICLIVLGVLTVFGSCITIWRYGLDDGDESLLEDDSCAYSKDDLFDNEFGSSRSPYYDNNACSSPTRHSYDYRTCSSSHTASYYSKRGTTPCSTQHHHGSCPHHAAGTTHASKENLSNNSHYEQTQQLYEHTHENQCPAHSHNHQEHLHDYQHLPEAGENHHSSPTRQDCIKSHHQNENSITRNGHCHQIVENGLIYPNKKLIQGQDQNNHKNSPSPLKNGKLTMHIHGTTEVNSKLSAV